MQFFASSRTKSIQVAYRRANHHERCLQPSHAMVFQPGQAGLDVVAVGSAGCRIFYAARVWIALQLLKEFFKLIFSTTL